MVCARSGVATECIPQRGGSKTPQRQAYERSAPFKQGQRFRAGIEGRMFGRSIRRSRRRYGNILCPGRRRARPRLRSQSRYAHPAHHPLDRVRLMAGPSPCSIRAIRREPKKGHPMNSSSI